MEKINEFSKNEDIVLMLCFKKGDISCFEKILYKYKDSLINFIYRFIGNRTDAEDIAQEVFLKIYKSKESYEPKAKFSTWLYTIASHLCVDYLRKRKIKTLPLYYPKNSGEEEKIREIADGSQILPDVLFERKQNNETIKTALFSLPDKQRIALTLRVYDDKSYEEIAKIIGCSVSAVESLLFRARQKLKKIIKNIYPVREYPV